MSYKIGSILEGKWGSMYIVISETVIQGVYSGRVYNHMSPPNAYTVLTNDAAVTRCVSDYIAGKQCDYETFKGSIKRLREARELNDIHT